MNLALVNQNDQETQESKPTFPEFQKIKLFDQFGNEVETHSGIANVETGKVNAVMSSKYTVFNHEDAYKIIEKAAKEITPDAKENVSFQRDGGYMKVTYDLPENFNVDVGQGDSLKTRLVGLNSVDGSKCLSFHIDFERLVCQNGMVGFTREFSFNRRHSRYIEQDTSNFDIAAQLKLAWDTVIANAEKLKNNAVDFKEGMDAIRAMVDRKVFPKKIETWVAEEWRRAQANSNAITQENGSNLWTLYNSFTSAIEHSTDNNGQQMSDQQKELYNRKLNSVILKMAA